MQGQRDDIVVSFPFLINDIYTIFDEWIFPSLSFGRVHFHIRGIRSDFEFLLHFWINFTNRIAPDGTPRSAASHLGLLCLPKSHIKDARLIRVKIPLVYFKLTNQIPFPSIFYPIGLLSTDQI